MNFLTDLIMPLLKGETTTPKTAVTLKRAQNGLNIAVATGALVGALNPSVQAYVTPEVITAAYGVFAAVNVYITTASTDKIGL